MRLIFCHDDVTMEVMEMATVSTKEQSKFTVREAAELLGLSVDAVRLHCRNGSCPAEYHDFPGTSRGFYLLTEESVEWLRDNVSPRNRGQKTDV